MSIILKQGLLKSATKTGCLFSYIGKSKFHRRLAPTLKRLRIRQKADEFTNQTQPKKPVHRNTFLEWNYDAEVYSFGKRLEEQFDEDLLQQALIDKSYVFKLEQEQRIAGIEEPLIDLKHNCDLASKGEDLIRRFVLQYLRHVLPRLPEEGIQSISEYLLTEDVLAHVSANIGTEELILSRDFPVEKDTLASVFKALVGALAESSGVPRATIFIRDLIITQLAERNINELWPIDNPVQVLQDICANEGFKECLEPRLIGEAGVNTILACYRVGIYLNKQMIALGFGETVETAHEMAAQDALRRLFHTSEAQLVFPFDLVLEPLLETQNPNVSIKQWSEANVKRNTIGTTK